MVIHLYNCNGCEGLEDVRYEISNLLCWPEVVMERIGCPARSCKFDIFACLLHPEQEQSFENVKLRTLNQVRMISIHVQKCSAYEDVANMPSSFHEVIIYKTSGTTKEVPCVLCVQPWLHLGWVVPATPHLEGLLTSLLTQSDTYFANWVHWSHRHSQSESRPLVCYFNDHWYIWTVASGSETAGWKVFMCN